MSRVNLPVPDPKPVVHDMTGRSITPERPDMVFNIRFEVRYWTTGKPLQPGDIIRWNPAKDVDSIATFQVLKSAAFKGANGVYVAELGRVQVDVHVAGETYRAPHVTHLIQLDAPPEDRYIP